MHIIGWIVFGLIVGLVAKFLMPGRDPGGFVITALIGIVGAVVGGFLGRVIGLYKDGDPVGFVTWRSSARSSCWRHIASPSGGPQSPEAFSRPVVRCPAGAGLRRDQGPIGRSRDDE